MQRRRAEGAAGPEVEPGPDLADAPALARISQLLPLPRRQAYPLSSLPADLGAATTVMFLAIPQGLAYATIAGLPPVVGLYAAAVPTIVSALLRSSSHVISGPTNALSLLVGAGVASGLGADPVATALTLALMVGVMQALAGALRLGALVDFISSAVVLGYITGAGVLIGVGQLYAATATTGPSGRLWVTLGGWFDTLGDTDPTAVAVAVGSVGVVVGVRWINRRLRWAIPSAIAALALALACNVLLGLEQHGLRVVADLAKIPAGLPPLTMPDLGLAPELVAVAIACAVLSLVESSSVARSIAARTGQHLDASTEFFGQGLSNLAAAFFGGYPVSGSLSRSVLAEQAGARTRMVGVLAGGLMIVVLLALGPVLDHTPLASLAGLMFVVAWDLVDVDRIRSVTRASLADAAAFGSTLLGSWVLPLDQAIYLGVGISLVLFLRRARMIRVVELVPDERGTLHETSLGGPPRPRSCPRIRVLHVEGPLFFGAAGELRDALTTAVEGTGRSAARVLVVRLKRAKGLDATTAAVFAELAATLRRAGRHLVLVGISAADLRVLERSGAVDIIGREQVFPSRATWFSALRAGIARATVLCGDACVGCPLAQSATPTATASEGPVPRPTPGGPAPLGAQ